MPDAKPRRPKPKATHPPVAAMVVAAIRAERNRKGSSLQAIKKYISTNYKVDAGRLSFFIRSAVIRGCTKGTLVRASGTGAAGRFRVGALPKPKKPKKKAKKPKAKKPRKKARKPKKAKKPRAKKAARKPKKAARKPAAKKPRAKKAAKPKRRSPKKARAKK